MKLSKAQKELIREMRERGGVSRTIFHPKSYYWNDMEPGEISTPTFNSLLNSGFIGLGNGSYRLTDKGKTIEL